ncbi:MAG: APC family permease [Solirubrobacterales bacterium]|nr:APC family permease [Solirubrobacterales bacterium]
MSVSDEVLIAPSEIFQGELKRCVGLRGLTMISLGSIIGSGWLLGALGAAQSAGPASLLSWILAGAILGVLALVHAELGATYPLSGGTARFPFLGFGALGGFTGGWMAWIQAVTIAPIEVEAALTYLESTSLHPGWVNANGTLTGAGIVVAGIAMALFTFINIMGVRWLAESNNITMIWKLAVPTLTIIVLLIVSFTGSNFTAGGGFMPFGAKGVFAALPLGVVFALEGFEQAIQVGGESRDPQHDIHRAVIISMVIGTIIYLLLEVAFIGALAPKDVAHSWTNPIPGKGAFGPYATLATTAGVGWLATILYIDSIISPAGTGLVYSGTSSRLSYSLSRNGYVPPALGQVDRRGVPFVSLIFCWVVGMLVFLPFPSWAGMVGLVTAATVLMYAMAPVSLAALRRSDPDRPRPYRLPAAHILAPLSFVCANFIVYWAGWNTIFWLYIFIIAGFVVFFVYQAIAPAGRKLVINWRAASWIPPWLIGLGIISYLGQYPTSKPSSGWPFGIALLAKQDIPFWVDLGVVAVFALVIYYWAARVAMPTEFVRAVETVTDREAAIGEVIPDAQATSVA